VCFRYAVCVLYVCCILGFTLWLLGVIILKKNKGVSIVKCVILL